jgi:diadenosine tetraphosphate (Ap4A) HIT family hydrolase
MQVVFQVEDLVRKIMQPDKINLAEFGNMVPHLHWHIIPRWQNDPYFPQPIWGAVQRESIDIVQDWRKKLEKKLMQAIEEHFKTSAL